MKSLLKQNKNKLAMRGDGVPKMCLYNLLRNLMKILSMRYGKASHTF